MIDAEREHPQTEIRNGDPIIVLAADEAFAMPLAVTVRSVLDNLSPERGMEVYVLDGGISPETKERLVRSWPVRSRFAVHWVQVDESVLEGIEPASHWNVVAYYRLLLPRLLPSVDRVIYLDSDIVVRHDLGEMWDTEMGGAACLAVQDMLTPYIDAAAAMPRFNIYGSLLIQRPILNFKSLDLSPTSPYFNSGILLLSLNRWRELDLSDSMIRCLHVNREFVNWTDQYALNVELAGRWDTLDPRWNQGSYIFEFPSWSFSALERRDFTLVRDHPHIVHFTSALKPWHANSPHPFRQEFFRYLDRTEWAGWRPSDDNSWSFWLWRQLSLIFTTTKHLRLRMQARYKLMREWASEMKAKLFATRSV